MNAQNAIWASAQPWFVRANQTLSGNWIVLVRARADDTADYVNPLAGPVLQFAEFADLEKWVAGTSVQGIDGYNGRDESARGARQ